MWLVTTSVVLALGAFVASASEPVMNLGTFVLFAVCAGAYLATKFDN